MSFKESFNFFIFIIFSILSCVVGFFIPIFYIEKTACNSQFKDTNLEYKYTMAGCLIKVDNYWINSDNIYYDMDSNQLKIKPKVSK